MFAKQDVVVNPTGLVAAVVVEASFVTGAIWDFTGRVAVVLAPRALWACAGVTIATDAKSALVKTAGEKMCRRFM